MNLLSHPPRQPYRNLLLAALIGVPAGSLAVSILLALLKSSSLSQSLTLVADALPISLFGYLMMAFLLVLYGLPALWLALRLHLAGPATALSIAILPGLGIWLLGASGLLASLPLAISVATGLAFVVLAYPGSSASTKTSYHSMQLIGTVAECFTISGRCAGVLFADSPQHIAHLGSLKVVVTRPDGSTSLFTAEREFARVLGVPGSEDVALSIRSATVADIPVGSVVSFAPDLESSEMVSECLFCSVLTRHQTP